MPQIIDPLNAKILRDLLEDGRKTFTQIAKENNTSKDVITKRYKQMKNAGIIVGATVHTSPACYGANLVADIYLEIKSSKEKQVLELVKKIPQFLYVYNIGIHPGFDPPADSWPIAFQFQQWAQLLRLADRLAENGERPTQERVSLLPRGAKHPGLR
jgi:predicted transcriptional regulator